MASEVSICNQALGFLGAKLITSMDDSSVESKLCDANYDDVRDAVLEAHNWQFATMWKTLVQLNTTPVGEYANAFQLPTDCLHVRFVGEDYLRPEREWQRVGNAVHSNTVTCKAQMIMRITDPGQYTPLFVQALAARLASDLAIPLTNSRTLMGDMWGMYERKVREAASRDNQQGRSRRIRQSWLRRGYL